ncbi:MAG: Molybdopterin-synthase adenylyltransferase [Planctomycetes bacterium ADurb.Bin126]|nr:MAG: Molybdopterin-synthase adenylyltransferase [Planctomycetes bacterium ADurb.Bin126]HOD80915.1 HesA/MoeB/ThiF family protein [Phycisphaerae bacterium]HQL75070.1 HesA/MoeB/ThiF family protein [Phycisphaerae bacterium]
MVKLPLSAEQQTALRARLGEPALRRDGLSSEQARRMAAETGAPLRGVEWFALSMGVVPHRYSRSIGTVGAEGQMKLLESRVLVVGLGGLGGHVAEMLARSGVGRVAGCDADVVEENNLNRQTFSTLASLGEPKTQAARRRLAEVNPAVEFEGFTCGFQDIPEEVLSACDLLFDCLDSVPARLELETRCASVGRPLIHGAIGGWYGQVGVVWPGSNLLSRICGQGGRGIERELGNPSFTPAVAAGLMVSRGIRVLLGLVQPGRASLQVFDLLNDEWETLEL